jgi:hypothetical protein
MCLTTRQSTSDVIDFDPVLLHFNITVSSTPDPGRRFFLLIDVLASSARRQDCSCNGQMASVETRYFAQRGIESQCAQASIFHLKNSYHQCGSHSSVRVGRIENGMVGIFDAWNFEAHGVPSFELACGRSDSQRPISDLLNATAIPLATSPALYPPIPSASTHSLVRSKSLR